MAFSLSPRVFSHALGRYVNLFVLFPVVFLFNLFAFLFLRGFFSGILGGAKVRHQVVPQIVQRNNLVGVTPLYGRATRALQLTTQVSSLCAMVTPPAAWMAPRPSAPSSPMPVIKTPTAVRANS